MSNSFDTIKKHEFSIEFNIRKFIFKILRQTIKHHLKLQLIERVNSLFIIYKYLCLTEVNNPQMKFKKFARSNYFNINKILGINLIGLMISSLLGAFMIAVVIKAMITINDNLQIIRGISELDRTARILDNLFNKFFTANGFGANTSTKNNFAISSDNNILNFSLWYAAKISNNISSTQTTRILDSISCSGRRLINSTADSTNPIEIFISMQNTSTTSGNGFIKCLLNNSSSLSLTQKLNSPNNIPLVNPSNMIKFFAAAIVQNSDPSTPSNPSPYQIIPITNNNLTSTAIYDSLGMKIALILRTTLPVLNKNKITSFSNILGINSFSFTATDKYLYKLLIIEAPFVNRDRTTDTSTIKTSIINYT